jgi:Zn-dependent M16 (insulinase) family peptidase
MHKSFTLKQEKYLSDLASTAYLLEHNETKAQVLYLKNSDPNKAFAISFKTLPQDSTGVAHILEHAVLNGSQKYPVKEPFTFLLKSTVATFINASTYPDKTVYPVASTHEQDLFNLTQVYLDAVFKPLISEEIFMQEGWHYELFAKDDPLKFKGVVFNEMKGAYSNVEDQVDNALRKHLYAGASFAYDSGGDPSKIPNLTYKDFVKFHADFYHPSNSKSFIYGDLNIEKFLDLLSTYFNDFAPSSAQAHLPLPKQPAPIDTVEKFLVSEAGEQKPIFIAGWLFDKPLSVFTFFTLEILEHLLIRSEASSIKKALLESNLGDSFYEYGYSASTPYHFFAFGLRDLHSAENAPKVRELITTELTKLSEQIDPKSLTGAINKIEFLYRTEIGYYNSKGLSNFSLTNKFWNYDLNPLEAFDFTPIFAKLNELAKQGYFEKFILEHFLQNNRSVYLTMLPDKELLKQQALAESEKLAEYKASLTPSKIDELIASNQRLKELQDAPDSEENLSKLPILKLSDINKEAKQYPVERILAEYDKIYVQGQEEGVVEVGLLFDVSHVSQELLPYLGVFSRVLLKLGTKTKSPQELASLLDLYFGQINTSVVSAKNVNSTKTLKKFKLSFKALEKNQEEAFDLINEILFEVKLVQTQKLKEIVLETKAGLETGLVSSGHVVALNNALSPFREDSYYADNISGIQAYLFYKNLAKNIDQEMPNLVEKLVKIQQLLLVKQAFSTYVGAPLQNKDKYWDNIDHIYNKLAFQQLNEAEILLPTLKSTSFVIPAKVNYVGMAFDGFQKGLAVNGLIWPLNRILYLEYLWNEIRVKGGAYGAFSRFTEEGLVAMASYRDPNVAGTLNVYENSGVFLKELDFSNQQLVNYKISSINKFEPHINSDEIVSYSWQDYAQGYTQELRQARKDQIFALTQEDLHKIGQNFDSARNLPKSISVLGGSDSLAGYEFDEVVNLF